MRDSILTTDSEAWQTNVDHKAHVAKVRPTNYTVTEKHIQNLIRILSDE